MGHNTVLNMENLRPKRKVRSHVFSAVTASATRGEMRGRYCGWPVFLLFLNTNILPQKSKQIEDQRSINKYSQILFHFMTNQKSYSQLKMHKFSKKHGVAEAAGTY